MSTLIEKLCKANGAVWLFGFAFSVTAAVLYPLCLGLIGIAFWLDSHAVISTLGGAGEHWEDRIGEITNDRTE